MFAPPFWIKITAVKKTRRLPFREWAVKDSKITLPNVDKNMTRRTVTMPKML